MKLPHSNYLTGQLLKAGKFDEVQSRCDDNVEFLRREIQSQQDLFVEAQRGKMES